ncbi:unnamed protein product [Ostreobium quekettii]|uniref:Uncharacterized protein n=1 Tax=Ostreobium quekettii TaxID=121088 RepID=A0A8S1ILR5_9CHLO|nr:unnamed protein product [Ostreobium quekettii]
MDAIVHALCAANQDQENVLQALRDFRGCYESWGPGKVEVLPQNAVKAITNVVSSHLPSVALVSAGLQCLWLIGVHASHAAAALRLEGGLQLCLKVLKRHQSRADITALACRTLAKCSSGSVASVQAILKEKGGWACLMGVLKANCTETTVYAAPESVAGNAYQVQKGSCTDGKGWALGQGCQSDGILQG